MKSKSKKLFFMGYEYPSCDEALKPNPHVYAYFSTRFEEFVGKGFYFEKLYVSLSMVEDLELGEMVRLYEGVCNDCAFNYDEEVQFAFENTLEF